MPAEFFQAAEVERIANKLIHDYHKHIFENSIHVEYLFRKEGLKGMKNKKLGTARKVSGHAAYLANLLRLDEGANREALNAPFFLITINWDRWGFLDEKAKVALVDHELMHCGVEYDKKENLKLVLIDHNFEGFNAEIERHGLWRQNAVSLAEAIDLHRKQMSLFEDDEPAKEEKPAAKAPKRSRRVTHNAPAVPV